MLVALLLSLELAQTTPKPLGDLLEITGNAGYFATGNTMALPFSDQPDGLACVLPQNTATIPDAAIGTRAQVKKAYLYYSGNVFAKASSPSQADLNQIDRNVSLTLPDGTTTMLQPEIVYRAAFTDGLLSNRTSFFYTARVDVTAALQAQPKVTGNYTFGGLTTPICLDPPDVFCNANMTTKCSAAYFRATASFMIVIVFVDPGLPPRTVKLFDGLEIIDAMTPSRTVSLTGVKVSAIPKGELTIYAVEGDAQQTGEGATVSANGRTPTPLGRVITPAPPAPSSLSCGDSSWPNWSDNLFDSSTVTDPAQATVGSCTRGIDLDSFDISSVLQANDTRVDVNVFRSPSATDVFGVAFAALQIDVFRPVLDVDSKKQVLSPDVAQVEPKTKIVYRVGVSNTGNIPATGVKVTDDLPSSLTSLRMLKTPPGSIDTSIPGHIEVSNIAINPGDVFEVRYEVELSCPVNDGASIVNLAIISASAEGAPGAVLTSPALKVSDPGGEICAGARLPGGTGPVEPQNLLFDRLLRGGAGCAATGAPWWLALPALWLLLRRRARRGLLVLFMAACNDYVAPPPDPAIEPEPEPVVVTKPVAPTGELPAPPSCGGVENMVSLTPGVCIDRFESVIENGAAVLRYGAVPTIGVSFSAAQSACVAAGKRLCTASEWERGCRGATQRLYPYGDSFAGAKCNGFDAEWGEPLEAGANSECVSDLGAMDMSGNVSEWVNADYPQLTGGLGKQLRGGSYLGNPAGLTCTALYGASPTDPDPRAGVRCCK